MKAFLYYTHTGTGEKIAEYLKNKGYEPIKIETEAKLPKKFFFLMMKGGFISGIHKRYPYKEVDLSKYDEVVFGTPIWNSTIAAPFNKVLDDHKEKGKKVILYSGGGKVKKAVKYLDEKYGLKEVYSIVSSKNIEEELQKLEDF